MKIHTVLVAGRMHKELQEMINQKKLTQTFRFMEEQDVTIEDLNWADALLSFGPTDCFENHSFKWVHSLGAGVDRFLESRKWKKNVMLTRTVCSFGQRISEYCLSYMLAELQHHAQFQHQQQQKQWKVVEPKQLSTQTVMIYGTGEIGRRLAAILKSFGVRVIGVSKSGNEKPSFDQVVSISKERDLLKEAGWIISTMPLTNETKSYFDQKWMNLVENAYFINVGRGATVDKDALIGAIEQKRIRKAYIDVFEHEPLKKESSWWKHSHIVITPHISAVTVPKEAVECFVETLQKVEQGEWPSNLVNIERGY
ncbi:D-2-hydroxyacid dehydrogenase [Priestia aryabhattai]|uniref:D-2-hydroxyacid dehydrogenase n=1 Tax=Priestia megaterium TaxID=1404 RepID=UPI0039B8CDF7